jgi:hypothetical protein
MWATASVFHTSTVVVVVVAKGNSSQPAMTSLQLLHVIVKHKMRQNTYTNTRREKKME